MGQFCLAHVPLFQGSTVQGLARKDCNKSTHFCHSHFLICLCRITGLIYSPCPYVAHHLPYQLNGRERSFPVKALIISEHCIIKSMSNHGHSRSTLLAQNIQSWTVLERVQKYKDVHINDITKGKGITCHCEVKAHIG